jgi:hypothetical protein
MNAKISNSITDQPSLKEWNNSLYSCSEEPSDCSYFYYNCSLIKFLFIFSNTGWYAFCCYILYERQILSVLDIKLCSCCHNCEYFLCCGGLRRIVRKKLGIRVRF